MTTTTTTPTGDGLVASIRAVGLKTLVGAADKIMLPTLPIAVAGIVANVLRPEWFAVGGPPAWLAALAWVLLAIGVVIWLWSVVLILSNVPKRRLITTGPFRLAKHPLYTGVSLLVIPAVGLLLNSWLGIAIGLVMYLASRRYAPDEERVLAEEFGSEWDAYECRVALPWL